MLNLLKGKYDFISKTILISALILSHMLTSTNVCLQAVWITCVEGGG